MPVFEFVVEGPPKTVNAKNKARYQTWIEKVRESARQAWPIRRENVTRSHITVEVTNYYRILPERPAPPDVDNILKPILDGMETVVYENDNSVSQVLSNRFDLVNPVDAPSPTLAAGLSRFSELVFVRGFWTED